MHQRVEIGADEAAGAEWKAGRAFERQGELARRHRPEIGGTQTQQAEAGGNHVVPGEGARSGAADFPGVALPSAGVAGEPNVADSSRTTIST